MIERNNSVRDGSRVGRGNSRGGKEKDGNNRRVHCDGVNLTEGEGSAGG
jgi:hypothetical protein